MIIKNEQGNIDIAKSMDSVQAELKEIWGQNHVSIKVYCSDEAKQEELHHDCQYCKHWDPDDQDDDWYEALPGNSCQKRHYLDGPECIDPSTAACKYWRFKEPKNA